jgi:isopentenyl-diphosphate Delta-isomerase
MILISPPLPVVARSAQASGHAGFVVGLSASHASIEWVDSSADFTAQSILISTASQAHFDIELVGAEGGLVQFSEKSLPIALDLLHMLRKSQHIQLCASAEVEHSSKNTGFSEIQLPVVALPEKNWSEIDATTTFMGRVFGAPILITGMTGGVAQGSLINERLARAASAFNIPMGVGSQRMALENPAHAKIFKLKDSFPNLFLIGNIGIGQLQQKNYLALCRRAVAMIDADALAIHVNVLQELIQVEGDRDFCGLIHKIGVISEQLGVPVVVKEVGAGLDVNTAKRLVEAGIKYLDVGGAGGTSWAHIEGLRSSNALVRRRGEVFRDWGIPTAKAIADIRQALPGATLIATGGIRDGLMARKAIFIGANMVGIGLPLMRAAVTSDEAPSEILGAMIDEFKIATMCSGLV